MIFNIFKKKKKPLVVIKVEPTVELIIFLKGKVKISWVYTGEDTFPFKHFYKWFFGRDSKFYVMRYTTGEDMFRREDILRFQIKKVNNNV